MLWIDFFKGKKKPKLYKTSFPFMFFPTNIKVEIAFLDSDYNFKHSVEESFTIFLYMQIYLQKYYLNDIQNYIGIIKEWSRYLFDHNTWSRELYLK